MLKTDYLFSCVLLFSIVSSIQTCELIVANNLTSRFHEEQSAGLHRDFKIATKISVKSRISKCRLFYEIDVPDLMYINKQEFQSADYNHVFITAADNITVTKIYAVRKKLFLSTFELKNTYQFKLHFHLPHLEQPTNISLKEPIVGVECDTLNTSSCPKLNVPNDSSLKPILQHWVSTTTHREEIEIQLFQREHFKDYSSGSLFILLIILIVNILIILYK